MKWERSFLLILSLKNTGTKLDISRNDQFAQRILLAGLPPKASPGRRHPEDVLELITCTHKTSIFGRLFGQMEICEKECHAWSAPKKINGTCRQTRRAGKIVLESAFRPGAPECTEAFLTNHQKLKGSNDMTTSWQVNNWTNREQYKQTKWTSPPFQRCTTQKLHVPHGTKPMTGQTETVACLREPSQKALMQEKVLIRQKRGLRVWKGKKEKKN